MTKVKMSLANVQGKLSRTEMKQIMAGDADQDSSVDGECIADGVSCSWWKNCCNSCLPTFKCGKSRD